MARNLEVKVSCSYEELAAIRARSQTMGVGVFEQLGHRDTYFVVAQGRLKVREIAPAIGEQTAELIAYRRANDDGSRWSNYQRVELAAETAGPLVAALAVSCGLLVVVNKQREVGIWKRTRIHLDSVDDLGSYVELETVAGAEDIEDDIAAEHALAIRLLGLDSLPIIAGSYSDLIISLQQRSAGGVHS